MKKQNLLNMIEREFPEITFLQAEHITAGWDHDVLILDDQWVFRFPKTAEYEKRFRAELKLLDLFAEQSPLPVPRYTRIAQHQLFGGYRIIQGRPLRRELLNRLAKPRCQEIAGQLGSFLNVLHSIPVEQARAFGICDESANHFWGKASTTKTLDDMRAVLFPQLDVAEAKWIEHQMTTYLSLGFEMPPRLLHSDLSDDHIFYDQEIGKLGGIIDFGDAEIADPALDFSGLWIYGEDFVNQVFRAYELPVDPNFLARSKLPPQVHSAVNAVHILQGQSNPKSLEYHLQLLRKEMAFFGGP